MSYQIRRLDEAMVEALEEVRQASKEALAYAQQMEREWQEGIDLLTAMQADLSSHDVAVRCVAWLDRSGWMD